MKKNKIGWIIILINILLGSAFIFSLNSDQIRMNFSYERKNVFLDNYFFASIALYYIYTCNIKQLLKMGKVSIGKLFKLTMITLFFPVILHEYGTATEFIIILNIILILFNYKEIRLLLLIIPIIMILAFFSEQYLNYSNKKIYAACQVKDLSVEQVENCVHEFRVYNFKTERTKYLTPINIKLAEGNEKIKESIQRKIIEQNEDESCKINETYEVMQIKTKKGIPCIG